MLIEFEQSYEYFIEYTSKSYLDLFPKTNLVYLSPDSKKVMDRLDLDRTYIIASIVDRHSKVSTYAKAKQEGIESQRLPITNYIKWFSISLYF